MTKNDKILQRYQELIDKNVKRCKDVDISVGRNRLAKIKSGCQNTIIWQENPNGCISTLNLLFLLIYGPIFKDLIPDGIRFMKMIPKDEIRNDSKVISFPKIDGQN